MPYAKKSLFDGYEKESIDAAKQKLGAERRHLDEQVNKLRIDEVKLEETRRQLDIVRCDLVREQEELNERNRYLTEQATELARRSDTVSNSEKELTEAQLRLERLKQEQNKGLAELQAREERLHESERKMNMERKEVARQHAELVQLRQQATGRLPSVCANCRVPVREHNASTQKTTFGRRDVREDITRTEQLNRCTVLGSRATISTKNQASNSRFVHTVKCQKVVRVENLLPKFLSGLT
ncbi:hypothetical protein X801_01284 [Opisthorchis viverrini]|uniref:Fas-binding factor 1 C-terminal domain-containing protein n=1 Tax=Opisthorchis viverrini TaxID=6198 RepID=A0A1S8X7V4_OPIVI|nr:hypothetical protein X801_01284 [Opisthorchis viverrini]